MAPNFFSKLVKTASSRDGARSRSPSPSSPTSSTSPTRNPTISVSRPSTHRASESIDVLAAAAAHDTDNESINPNVTVIPPSPRTSDMSISDGSHTPPTGPSSDDLHAVKKKPSRRTHSLSLTSNPISPTSPSEDDAVTPTPSRPTMNTRDREATVRPLSHSSSTGDLRAEASNQLHQHPRSATVGGFDRQQAQELRRTPSLKSNKSTKSNRSGLRLKLRSDKSEKGQSRPGTPNHRPTTSPPPPNILDAEDGVAMSPIVESPTRISPTNPLVRNALSASATLPNFAQNGLLSAHDNSDAASVYSVSSTTKKNRIFRRLSMKEKEPTSPSLPSGGSQGSSKSPKRKNTGLAGAIAASGLAMANPMVSMPHITPAELIAREQRISAAGNASMHRSRTSIDYPRSSARSRQTSLSYPGSDMSDRDSFVSGVGNGSDDDDDDLDLDADDIPVTGFAVASARRNQEFHEMFPAVPEGDYLIEDYGCALQREILVQGRLYVSENHVCFHANIFGWVTDLTIPMYDVTALDKRMTAFVIPNAIQLTTRTIKYTFTSFLSRDTTFDVIYNVWRLARPEDSSIGSQLPSARESLEDSSRDGTVAINGKTKVVNKVTMCACSKAGEHYSETAMEVILPGTPEKIYNLMFTSGFIKDFMRNDQKLTDIQISDWAPLPENPTKLTRNMSYIKPLNGSIGPKSTKCEIRDETAYCDFEEYVTMLTATRTPEVPSGNVFVVKTRTCIMWASSVSTRIIVTTQVEWSGRSFIKGIIERSAIEGQKTYHNDLEKGMRDYISKHQSEFIPEGVDAAAVVAAAAEPAALDSPKPKEDGDLSPEAALKKREHERNQRSLQWAYDTFEGAVGVAKRSTTGAIELLRDAWDQSSTSTIQYLVIALLVLSNIWTLLMMGTREEAGRRKEIHRAEEKEKWVQGVVSSLWDEIHAAKAGQQSGVQNTLLDRSQVSGDIKAEIAELAGVLDKIEERVQSLRKSLQDLD